MEYSGASAAGLLPRIEPGESFIPVYLNTTLRINNQMNVLTSTRWTRRAVGKMTGAFVVKLHPPHSFMAALHP